ncbi:MFS transporter [Mucilaginibacter sp. Bleaf8]|uniref:MFS transporter n=1 Tax=Mucilaginibacter sp. Bleaf8 TaxID=2834430 RepID=UPI001BCA923F|nr:MFS transporter [Mucilaginibacter sp. Bleaf8]MBS7563246.1 MFS transporter [Mucilaginibacter sp. Bleaf8]
MTLRPSKQLTENQVKRGLNLVLADGLTSEAMVVFTSGTFLTAMAVNLGASNFQLGLFAALPTFTTVFQLFSIWMVRHFNNRRVITALFNFLARVPILVIGLLPFLFTKGTSIQILLLMLFFQHVFGDIAGASWNSWMKDLVPGEKLGSFFSRRSRMGQILNVTLSLTTALCIDYIKQHYPQQEILTYNILFLIGGALGLASVGFLLRTPEPESRKIDDKLFTLISKPLKDKNFKTLLVFNSFWAFALNLATPFFAVYMLKTIGISLSYIIALGILGQISGIISLKLWGKYSDWFSNKTILRICAPLYIGCILMFALTNMPGSHVLTLALLTGIHIISGISTAGINLALNNIGIKLAPNDEAIAYISAKNMLVAFFSTIAPMLGGLMADYFANHQFTWNLQLKDAADTNNLTLLDLQGWNYFFIIGGLLAMLSLRFLNKIKEDGEVDKDKVVVHMHMRFRHRLRKKVGDELTDGIYHPRRRVIKMIKKRRQQRAAGDKKV